MNRKIWKRRDFLKAATITAGGLLLSRRKSPEPKGSTLAQELELIPRAYLPLVVRGGNPSGRVVHVHASGATSWNFGSDYYGDHVDQDVVNEMVDQGVMSLTGTSSVAQAWQSLIPDYTSGKAIAIKVNFNNAGFNCEVTDTDIDALIHPVNAIVQGLKQMGVAEADVWVYDATRPIPNKFAEEGCLYSGVQFFGTRCQNEATFDSSDPNAVVDFSSPGLASQKVTDVLVNATYLINIPIMKKHGGAGITLSFKNHLGTIPNPNNLHDYLGPGAPHYAPGCNPMVDIWLNPHVGPKTQLVVGDGLFGNRLTNTSPPQPWTTFEGGAPNSLFFATDPVAIDCVMCDFLEAESGAAGDGADVYLQIAEEAELGGYERGNPWEEPWGSGYGQIDYNRIEV